jgi:uncharacterized protein
LLADRFARAGIAVLRFDDRGVGNSKGVLTSLETEFGDARAAFEWLEKQPEIDPKRVGLVGHSIGGTIVATVAARTQRAAFVVVLAGPGIPGSELVPMQIAISMERSNTPPEIRKMAVAAQREVGAAIASGDETKIRAALRASYVGLAKAAGEPVPPDSMLDQLLDQKVAEVKNPWVNSFFKIDPAASFRRIKVPVLALTGEKDFQVPPDANLAKIEAAVRAGGNKDVTAQKRPGLNHLFQHASTGLDNEYPIIDETFDPETLELITTWIGTKTAPK